ncbi:hypothetical protein [Rhizobium sp. BK176]|uniref:hypothetical protein n=1 Tax=Rhizobium sp. BK176 TaxID=2587071 RepID=UPI0021676B80|nr:hypothetical protein [Rhizobium sp. BK176]MCS4089560.1 flagellar biosynthesis/type III secretory pathway M-ring protein FliF/YscJ [Rhizobium sp. BK176]
MIKRAVEFGQEFKAWWAAAGFSARANVAAMGALMAVFGGLVVAFCWLQYRSTVRYAEETGTNSLWLFASYALITAVAVGFGWAVVRAQLRQAREEERETDEFHARMNARIDSMHRSLDAIEISRAPYGGGKITLH